MLLVSYSLLQSELSWNRKGQNADWPVATALSWPVLDICWMTSLTAEIYDYSKAYQLEWYLLT